MNRTFELQKNLNLYSFFKKWTFLFNSPSKLPALLLLFLFGGKFNGSIGVDVVNGDGGGGGGGSENVGDGGPL